MFSKENRFEVEANKFWQASLAWKRVPGFVEGVTVGGLLEDLSDLACWTRSKEVAKAAQDLSDQIVKGRCRRNKIKGSRVIPMPNISGHTQQAQKRNMSEAA